MADCTNIVEKVYNSGIINDAVSQINPEHLRNDLKQELAIALLEMPCEKLAGLYSENTVNLYALKTIWKMATSSNKSNKFYQQYRKSDIQAAMAYFNFNLGKDLLSPDMAALAERALIIKGQSSNVNEYHEATIFNKYIELGSCSKVAVFYDVPNTHVKEVVRKVRNELKTLIKSRS